MTTLPIPSITHLDRKLSLTADGTSVSSTVVVADLLHDGGVFVFRGDGKEGSVRCVTGRHTMRTPAVGDTWELEGVWEAHPVHGPQIRVTTATLSRPSGRLFVEAVARNTRNFPGIGVARARAIWDAHGEAVFDQLDGRDEDCFVPQVGPKLAAVIVNGWRTLDHETKAYRWLTRHGFSPALAARVIAIYGGFPVPKEHASAAERVGRVVWHLEADPYRMLAFSSWRLTDEAALQIGLAPRDPRRLAGAIEAACAAALARGHTWVGVDEVQATAARLLSLSVAAAREGLQIALERGAVISHAGGVQLPGAHLMERYVEARCHAMIAEQCLGEQSHLKHPLSRVAVDTLLDAFERREGYTLTIEQRDATWMATTRSLALLLGGPGVGKTSVLKAVHHVAEAQGRTVHQAALAGRAARRMTEATNRPAMTIAKLLVMIDGGELKLDDEPLVIIDEASMCDLATLYRLLRRSPPGMRLLLVGDPGQLAPIGFGLTFHVMAAATGSGSVSRTELTTVMRQADATGIPAVCRSIRSGNVPDLSSPNWFEDHGVSFLRASSTEVTNAVIDVLAHLGPMVSAQVIGSLKSGPGGVHEINQEMQRIRSSGRTLLNGHFFKGDPIIITRNNPDLGVMNGDLGEVISNAEDGGLSCRFDGVAVVLPRAMISDQVDLAYAITCHKAQGSEFPGVVVPIVANSRLLDRTLLLTAVSRARRRVVLVGDYDAFAKAVTSPPHPARRRVGIGAERH